MDVNEICDAIGELSDGHFIQIMDWMTQEVQSRLMQNAGEAAAQGATTEADMAEMPF